MPSCASSGLGVTDHDRSGDCVRIGLGEVVLRVERTLAEREHVRARARDALCERGDFVVESVGGNDAIHETPVERGARRRSSRR